MQIDNKYTKAKLVEIFQKIDEKYEDATRDWFSVVLDNRIKMLLETNPEHITIQLISDLPTDAQISEVAYGQSSVTIAQYDETVLWLDNHISSEEYLAFSNRDNLMRLFKSKADALAQFIMNTRLGNQFNPVVVNSVQEIPRLQPDGMQYLENIADEHILALSNLSYDIEAPAFHELEGGMKSLKFTTWTKTYGWLRQTRVLFQQDGTIVNILNSELARFIGQHSTHL